MLRTKRNNLKRFLALHTFADGEGGDAGTGGGDAGTGGQQQQNQQQQNNNENNIIESGSMWDTEPSDKGNNQQQQQQNNTANQNQNTNDGGTDHFAAHVESLDLGGGIDLAKVQQDLQQGNTESFAAALKQSSEQAYKAAITDSNKLISKQVKDAVASAVSEAGGNFESNMVIRDMNEALPYTMDKAIAPVAKAVLTQLMTKGMTQAEAIKGVDEFVKKAGGLAGMKIAPKSKAKGGFQNPIDSNAGTEDESGETDWAEFLGMPAEQK